MVVERPGAIGNESGRLRAGFPRLVGEATHKGRVHPGERHPAAPWDRAHAVVRVQVDAGRGRPDVSARRRALGPRQALQEAGAVLSRCRRYGCSGCRSARAGRRSSTDARNCPAVNPRAPCCCAAAARRAWSCEALRRVRRRRVRAGPHAALVRSSAPRPTAVPANTSEAGIAPPVTGAVRVSPAGDASCSTLRVKRMCVTSVGNSIPHVHSTKMRSFRPKVGICDR
jgi:hypothetical protein